MNNNPEQIIADILKNELDLCDDQVVIRNQNYKLPSDQRLYVVVGQIDSRAMAVTNSTIATDAGMDEIQQVQARENIQIDLFSVTTEAMNRRLEVLAALSSVYAEQAQEINQFKIFEIPQSFLNTTAAEGGSMLNRFSILIPCFVWYRKQKAIGNNVDRKYNNGDYYDQYPARVDTEQTIGTAHGIIEFNLTE